MEHEPWDFTAVLYEATSHFSHGFLDYSAPRREHVSEAEFDLYKDVVAGAYRFHDMLLGRLLEIAGPDATVIVVSGHGFHSDAPRPPPGRSDPERAVLRHRRFGVFCMKGPGVRRDERIYGASLLDVAPTVLSLLGLPKGDDMPGRPLREALETPPVVERIASWDVVPGPCGMMPPEVRTDPWIAYAAIERLVDLGYLASPGEDIAAAVRRVDAHRRFNLARALLHSRRVNDAAPVFERLTAEEPDDPRYALGLAHCRLTVGDFAGCRALVAPIIARGQGGPTPIADLLLGTVLAAEGAVDEALASLIRAEGFEPLLPALHVRIGAVYIAMKRWPDAERAFERALSIDGDCADAHDGLASALLGQSRLEEAAEAALRAVGLEHHFPEAHFRLGVALARLGCAQRALQAFDTCLSMRPEMEPAARWRARLRGIGAKP
jgi:hypothetical protein